MKIRQWLMCAQLLLTAALVPALAQTRADPTAIPEIPATRELLKSLQAGGYVLYIRHATTDTTKPDAVPKVDLKDCSTQRNLNEEGRKFAAALGRQISSAGIPVGEVIHSPFCRTRETAQLAFAGPRFKLREELRLAYPSNMTAEEKKPVIEMTRKLLSSPVPKGTNRVLVSHSQNLAELIDFFVKPEGAVAIIRPKGEGQFEYVASIVPTAWSALLK